MAAKTEKRASPKGLPNRLGIAGWVYAGRYWIERYAYLFHRITGLALVLYLCLHVFVVGERAKGEAAWNAIMDRMDGPLLRAGEFLLLVAFLVHAINGFRLILTETGFFIGRPGRPTYPFKTSIDRQRPLLIIVMLVGAVFIGLSTFEFFHLF
jgi:succinate dehydrogenase / fumarate reductase cytochrome b subunit